jgi:carbamoyl-phosphate synthase L subunit-like protein
MAKVHAVSPAMEALVVGHTTELIWAIPYLLSRAGFAVDVMTTSRAMRLSRFARRVDTVASFGSLVGAAVLRARTKPYDWVIATDDMTLGALAELEWPADARPKLLPAAIPKCRLHLYSKTGLSRVLQAGGIRTPPFRVACNLDQAFAATNDIGYPVFVKLDAAGGGEGVHECTSESDLARLRRLFDGRPLLIQKRIDGTELDLSAIYLEEDLVHFTYSTIDRTIGPFQPSVVRTYYPSRLVKRAVFDELSALGSVLGASGFVTISCIEAADGSGRYYIEADMRPTVWADFSLFYGEDAAARIRSWFAARVRLTQENAVTENAMTATSGHAPLTIPYFLRLRLWELLVNRHRVWRYIPVADKELVRRLLVAKLIGSARAVGRSILPRSLKIWLKARLAGAGLLLD